MSSFEEEKDWTYNKKIHHSFLFPGFQTADEDLEKNGFHQPLLSEDFKRERSASQPQLRLFQAKLHSLSDIPDESSISDVRKFTTRGTIKKSQANNNDFDTIALIKDKLEDMGFKATTQQILLSMRSHAQAASIDAIIGRVILDILDGASDKEEYFNQRNQLDPNLNKYFCYRCYMDFEASNAQSKPFDCNHPFCRPCLLAEYQKKVEKDQNIESIKCLLSYCEKPILIENFAKMIPEIDSKSFGEIGEGESRICEICFEEIKISPEILKVFDCNNHYYCYDCTLSVVKQGIHDMKVLDIKCPCQDCGAHLIDEKAKNLLPSYVMNRYTRFKRNALIERDPNVRWCSRAGCQHILRGENKNPKLVCPCKQITCFLCGNIWHPKKTCEKALEDEYKIYSKEKYLQFCPECKSRVEKHEGCNHMTCPICSYEWCWICRGEYVAGHFNSANPFGCPGQMYGKKVICYKFYYF